MEQLKRSSTLWKDFEFRMKDYLNVSVTSNLENIKIDIGDEKIAQGVINFCLLENRNIYRKGMEEYLLPNNDLKSYPSKQKVIDSLKEYYGNSGTDIHYEAIGELYFDSRMVLLDIINKNAMKIANKLFRN